VTVTGSGISAAEREEMIALARDFVRGDVRPVAAQYDREDRYPEDLFTKLAELGFYGLVIPERYGGVGVDSETFAEIQMELAQGWLPVAGILTTHFTSASMILQFGTEEQRDRLLPKLAAGKIRCATSLTEPDAGSDLQALRMTARRDGDAFVIDGVKTWTTHGLNAGLVVLLTKTDPSAQPPHRGMTTFLLEKEPGVATMPGLEIPPKLPKLGYKGIETTELVFDGYRIPASAVLGGEEGIGRGFKQYMLGMEIGRLSVSAKAVGLATDALNRAIAYAKERRTFGKTISQHQAIQVTVAQMATRVEAARQLVLSAARKLDRGERVDLEVGMAKLFATETAGQVSMDAMRVLGGYGYSPEYEVERIFRDAPALILGEGSNEIQQILIARRLLGD
jgi:butyryl-CoA dehydrogenase